MDNLEKFIIANKKFYNLALNEIKAGKKRSHWIWFIFPQLRELGHSDMALFYGINNIEEARAYLNNKYLKNNLITISKALLELNNNNPTEILGYPDNLKVQSCMTLFYFVNPKIDVFKSIQLFKDVIDKYYDGKFDENTLNILERKNCLK